MADFFKKLNKVLRDINDVVTPIANALDGGTSKSNSGNNSQAVKTGKRVEAPLPPPRLFDKDGSEIRPDLRIK